METQTNVVKPTVNVPTFENMQWEERTCRRINLKEMQVNETITCQFIKTREKTIIDRGTGEPKKVLEYIMLNDSGERFSFISNAGFNLSFDEADVQENDWIKFTKGPKAEIGNGRTMNTFTILVART